MVEIKNPFAFLVTMVGVSALSLATSMGIWGNRGEYDIYKTTYNGLPAVVKGIDKRFCPDGYYILLNNRDKIMSGEIISDDGKVINVNKKFRSYSIKDLEEIARD